MIMRIVFEPDQYKDLYIIFDNSEKELIFTEDSDDEDKEMFRINLDDLMKICEVCNSLKRV